MGPMGVALNHPFSSGFPVSFRNHPFWGSFMETRTSMGNHDLQSGGFGEFPPAQQPGLPLWQQELQAQKPNEDPPWRHSDAAGMPKNWNDHSGSLQPL